ncbi:MlaD family protein, partial [Mycobacterium sp. NPDC003449]
MASSAVHRIQQRFKHWRYDPPYKSSCAAMVILLVAVLAVTWMQFRGVFEDKVALTVLSGRSGLSMDPGSKVTFNGVPIGRLASVDVVEVDDSPQAKLTLDVDPKYLKLIPSNADVELRATTVFGNKYISFLSPENPSADRLTASTPIEAKGVTTEFNTLFETITAISEQVDPIKLNETLTATAQALD